MRWAWALVAAGLAIRIVLIPAAGFPTDIGAFEDWALAFARFGPHELYADTSNLRWAAVDYPPAYMLVLGAVGWIALHVLHITESGGLVFAGLVKAPAILADIALAYVVYRIALRVAEPARARVAFGALLLLPPLWIVSGYWGQVDSVPVLALAGALLAMLSGRITLAWVCLALAILIKPQSAPVALLLLVWELRTFGASLRLLRSAALGTLLAYGLAAVFAPTLEPTGALRWLFERYLVGIGKYASGSQGAFNAYTVVGPFFASDAQRLFGVSLHDLGNLAYGVLLAAIVARLWPLLAPGATRQDRERALLGAAFVALVGLFMVVTRMHERYLLPGLTVGALAALWSPWTAFAEATFATIFTLNCAFILAGFYGGSHHAITLKIAHVASFVNVAAFVSILVRYFADGLLPRRTSSRTVALKNARSSTTS